MKQKSNCLAPGAGGGGGVAAPFSRREALSSAGFGLVSRAVMLPLRALMYYFWCLWSASRMQQVVNCFRRASTSHVGCRRQAEKMAGGWRAAVIWLARSAAGAISSPVAAAKSFDDEPA